jgi:ATP-dependent DNA helicase RecG
MPPGRTPISTILVPPTPLDRAVAYERLRSEVEAGRQAYVVCPLVEGSAKIEVTAATEEYERLGHEELKGLRLGLLHGQMKSSDKEAAMARFRAGETDVLVSTTVIEVGVDVPNATIMVIENADRFGLAQLHQLRGRVGRGAKSSECILVADPRTADAEQRLDAMRTARDGFEIAERDLAIRGPGELFGTRQSGMPPFLVADIVRDIELLRLARRDARAWIDANPVLAGDREALLRRRLLKAYGEALGLGDVG